MRKFTPLELSYENLDKIFEYCLANEHDVQTDIYESSIYMQNIEHGTAKFSKKRLEEQKKDLKYLIGQLRVTHNPKPMSVYSIDNLKINYKGEIWCGENINRPIMMPHLTRYFEWNSPLFRIDNNLYIYTRIKDFIPTLSPSDSKFEEWWKENKSKWE